MRVHARTHEAVEEKGGNERERTGKVDKIEAEKKIHQVHNRNTKSQFFQRAGIVYRSRTVSRRGNTEWST